MLDALIGGLIGGTFGPVITLVVSAWLEDRRVRRSIAGAFAGEVGSIHYLLTKRGYRDSLERHIAHVEATKTPTHYTVRVAPDYLTIYPQHSAMVGKLPPIIAQELVRFYAQVRTLVETASPGGDPPTSVEHALYTLRDLRDILDDTLGLGGRLTRALHSIANGEKWRSEAFTDPHVTD